jgi:hypothetical protein
MAAAIATKDLGVIEATQQPHHRFHDELLAQALADSPLLAKVSFREIACHAIEETAEAVAAIGTAGMSTLQPRARRRVREAGEKRSLRSRLYRERAARIPRRKLTLTLLKTTRGDSSRAVTPHLHEAPDWAVAPHSKKIAAVEFRSMEATNANRTESTSRRRRSGRNGRRSWAHPGAPSDAWSSSTARNSIA